jgi:competence protein ComEC
MFNPNRLILIMIFLVVFDFFIWGLIVFEPVNKNLELYFLDVGQGDSELVILPNGPKVLIDAGPNNKVISELASVLRPTDRYIDLIVLSHPQTDHFTGLIDVLKRYQIGAFIFNGRSGTANSWSELVKVIGENEIPVVILAGGDKIHYLDSQFNFLLPDKNFIESSDLNETALVPLLQSQNAKILFTGDINTKIEDYLVQKYDLDIDILKVAHHGSKYSSSENFLKSISPKIAVIEVGKNSYGHPTNEVLQRLASAGSQIFRTDKDGVIKLIIENQKISVFNKK